jgi:uncharacterized repeat protein (TIGR03803 family)
VGGTLYGTTFAGGSYSCAYYRTSGCGTVFSVTPSGTEQVLHGFGAHRDGSNPRAGLIDVGGTFYGTTEFGGYACYGTGYYYSDCGTVYSITPSGAESVLFSFGGRDAKNGSYPLADLIDVKGTLYGTTRAGGSGVCYSPYTACGVVYSITTQGGENVLHSFGSGTDGAYPDASLIELKGKLYGTTYAGAHHFGTVFRITLGGKEKVLHHFGAADDGAQPVAGLIAVNGTLYGTTLRGGTYSCGSQGGCGTVFSITPGGTERVLHSFGNGTDGAGPQASLIELKGVLYGTTTSGGEYSEGAVFSSTPAGKEKVLHHFGTYGGGGINPHAGLTDVGGTLYGTTYSGGAHGYGTVFSLKP